MLKIPSGLRAFIFGIVFALIVGWASSVGSFAWLNLKAHDGALKLPLLSAHENRTLLINNDLEPSKNLQPRLDELLIELAKLKPRSVVLLSRAYWPKEALSDLREPTYGAFTAAFEHPVIKPVTLFEFTAIDGVYRQFSLPQQQPNAATLYGFAATERSQGYLNFF